MDYEWANTQPRKIGMDELKQKIIEVKRKSGMYAGMAGSPKTYEKMIQSFNSFDEVVRYFGRPSKSNYFAKLWAGPFDG